MRTAYYTTRTAPDATVQPEVTLSAWLMFELTDGSRHFCGFRIENDVRRGRVSTDIVRFEPSTMTGVTTSGRVYRLEGPPSDAEETLMLKEAWLSYHGLPSEAATDVDHTDRIANRLM